MSRRLPGGTTKYMRKRSKQWDAKRRAKLRALAERKPKLVYDATEIGRLRREWEPYLGREAEIVGELKAEGFSLGEIGETMFMHDQAVVHRLRQWRERTS